MIISTKINYRMRNLLLIVLVAASALVSSCSNQQEELAEIAADEAKSYEDRVMEILNITGRFSVTESEEFEVIDLENGTNGIVISYTNKNFIYESTEDMESSVKQSLGRVSWRTLLATKSLNISKVGIEYNGVLQDGTTSIVYSTVADRVAVSSIGGFESLDPYSNVISGTNTFDFGSDERNTADAIARKLQYVDDNPNEIYF